MRPMNPPEKPCPVCGAILKPIEGRPGLLECVACRSRISAQPSFGEAFKDFITAFLKVVLVFAGILALGAAILFAGCFFLMR